MKLMVVRNALQLSHPTVVRRALVCLILILLCAAELLLAQESREGQVGVPLDWSTRHILFTNGASPEVAAKAARDPRSWINWNQRSSYVFPKARGPEQRPRPFPPPQRRQNKIDWAMSLGPTGGMPIAESPAKYSLTPPGITAVRTTSRFTRLRQRRAPLRLISWPLTICIPARLHRLVRTGRRRRRPPTISSLRSCGLTRWARQRPIFRRRFHWTGPRWPSSKTRRRRCLTC